MRSLAERSGVDVGVISRVERGKYKPPKISTIDKLTRALELSAAEEEELLQLSGRLRSPSVEHDESLRSTRRMEPEEGLAERLTALEERVRRLEERSGTADGE